MTSRQKAKRPTDDDLAEQLRAAGLRRTQPRVAVLRYMLKVGHPVAHAEAAEALAKLELDRVSVYRVLLDLARVKILRRTDLGDHVWRFDVVRGEHAHAREHPHFVCTSCGAVECLPGSVVQIAARGKGPRAVRTRDVEVQLKECSVRVGVTATLTDRAARPPAGAGASRARGEDRPGRSGATAVPTAVNSTSGADCRSPYVASPTVIPTIPDRRVQAPLRVLG